MPQQTSQQVDAPSSCRPSCQFQEMKSCSLFWFLCLVNNVDFSLWLRAFKGRSSIHSVVLILSLTSALLSFTAKTKKQRGNQSGLILHSQCNVCPMLFRKVAFVKENLIETKMFLSNVERPANIITHTQLYPEARQYLRLSSWPDWSNLLFLLVFLLNRYTKETSTSFKIWWGRDECVVIHWWSSVIVRSDHTVTPPFMMWWKVQANLMCFTWRSLIWLSSGPRHLLVHLSLPVIKALVLIKPHRELWRHTSLFLGDQVPPDSLHVIITDGNKSILNTVSPKGWSFY